MSTVTDPHRHNLRLGVSKTLPLLLGLIPFGLAYGILATQAGLTVIETMAMSLIVFAGASQFMAVGMFAAAADPFTIILSTWLINLRHLVMGLSLSPYLAKVGPWWQRMLAFGMADEVYLTTITHYREQQIDRGADQGADQGSPHFMLGSAIVLYIGWAATSLTGALVGRAISDPLAWGLDFAMPATFVTMLLPLIVSWRTATVVAVSAVTATATYVLVPGKWYIIVAVVVATTVGVLLEEHQP